MRSKSPPDVVVPSLVESSFSNAPLPYLLSIGCAWGVETQGWSSIGREVQAAAARVIARTRECRIDAVVWPRPVASR